MKATWLDTYGVRTSRLRDWLAFFDRVRSRVIMGTTNPRQYLVVIT